MISVELYSWFRRSGKTASLEAICWRPSVYTCTADMRVSTQVLLALINEKRDGDWRQDGVGEIE